ncbi:MAG TPA: hypothetical protein VG713_05910 [Pirellulales bacterium]|nr:hypothetical protein [Pirellulales bacterium]
MSSPKSRSGGAAGPSDSTSVWWRLVKSRWTALVLLIAAIGAGSQSLWKHVSAELAIDPRYRLDPDQITLTARPAWIRADILREVLRDSGLDRASTLDPQLAQRIAKGFEMHPWIARTIEVRKLSPAGLAVQVEYRRPVCMVEVPGGLFAVDEHAVLLPSHDFLPGDAQQYPRLGGVQVVTEGPVGTRWEDARVQGGAQVAAALLEHWNEFHLQRIVPVGESTEHAPSGEPEYEIYTRGKARIRWGHAPGVTITYEPAAAEKVARLKKYVADHGPFDTEADSVEIDLRTGGPLRVTPRVAAADDDSAHR